MAVMGGGSYSAFVLIIPFRLEDIQAASVCRLGFARRVIGRPLGSVADVSPYRTFSGSSRGRRSRVKARPSSSLVLCLVQ